MNKGTIPLRITGERDGVHRDTGDAVLEEPTAYRTLVELLESHKVPYRMIDHEPEGRTAEASSLRGHALSAAAKSMVVALRFSASASVEHEIRYVVAVVPGDTRVNLKAVRRSFEAVDARFATLEVAEALSRCVSGSIVPFSFDARLAVVADPVLLESEHLYFNAARLDRSVELCSADYAAVAAPRFASIAKKGS